MQYHLTPSGDIDPKILQSATKKHVKINAEEMVSSDGMGETSNKQTVHNSETDSQDDISIFCEDLKSKRKAHLSGDNKTNVRKTAIQSKKTASVVNDAESNKNISIQDKSEIKSVPGRNLLHKERVINSVPSLRGGSKGIGIKTEPSWQYVWNQHLLHKVQDTLHPDWLLYITHGFIGQSNIQVFGKSVYLTLIARRSNKFAGMFWTGL